MNAIRKAKNLLKRHQNKVVATGVVTAFGMTQAHAALDMSQGTEQLALGLAAVGALGAAKLAPSALVWVWGLVTGTARRG